MGSIGKNVRMAIDLFNDIKALQNRLFGIILKVLNEKRLMISIRLKELEFVQLLRSMN